MYEGPCSVRAPGGHSTDMTTECPTTRFREEPALLPTFPSESVGLILSPEDSTSLSEPVPSEKMLMVAYDNRAFCTVPTIVISINLKTVRC